VRCGGSSYLGLELLELSFLLGAVCLDFLLCFVAGFPHPFCAVCNCQLGAISGGSLSPGGKRKGGCRVVRGCAYILELCRGVSNVLSCFYYRKKRRKGGGVAAELATAYPSGQSSMPPSQPGPTFVNHLPLNCPGANARLARGSVRTSSRVWMPAEF